MRKKITTTFVIMICALVIFSFLDLNQKCKVESMLLKKGDFPQHTLVDDIRSPIAEMPDESAGFTATYGRSLIYYEASRFPGTVSAEKEFANEKRRASVLTEYSGPWETPPELSHKSSIFKNYYVACGKIINMGYQCRMIGQYDEYYVFFFAYISNEGMTYNIFNNLLQTIDLRAEQCLKK
jgi:hypothetical protein